MDTKKEITQETEEQKIERLKEKYGDVYTLTYADGVKAYFRSPNRKELDLALSFANTQPIHANSIIFEKCLIREASDSILLDEKKNEKYILGSMKQLAKITESIDCELKKN